MFLLFVALLDYRALVVDSDSAFGSCLLNLFQKDWGVDEYSWSDEEACLFVDEPARDEA